MAASTKTASMTWQSDQRRVGKEASRSSAMYKTIGVTTMSLVSLAGILTGCAQSAVSHSASSHEASFCEIIDDPQSFDRLSVRIRGIARPPDHAPLRLESEGCSGAIVLFVDDLSATDPNRAALESNVWRRFPEIDAGVFVELIGEFRWRGVGRPSRVLVVSQIVQVSDLPLE
jgi:hypothetical protein